MYLWLGWITALIVIENVPQYADTASAQILRQHLRDSGYTVQEVILAASDFGCLENRVRWFLCAATRGITIDLQGLAPVVRPVKMLSDVLEDIGPDDADWRTFDYLKTKEIRVPDSKVKHTFMCTHRQRLTSGCSRSSLKSGIRYLNTL